MSDHLDSWQIVFFVSASLFVLFRMFRGWRQGVVLQLVSLLGLILAYAVAIFGGRLAVPVFRPLGYPDFIVSLIAGSVMAMVVYVSIITVGHILFRRTNQQSLGLMRIGYGLGGSAIGMIFGFLTVWMVVLAIRLLGSVAETELEAAQPAPRRLARPEPRNVAFVESMAHMKQSLEQGPTGAIVETLDPIPTKFYDLVSKITLVVGSQESIERFLSYPGARPLSQHPRIVALQSDPNVVAQIQQRNYLGLLKNESIVQAVNDPEVGHLVRNFELEKALDYALGRERPVGKR